MKNVSLCMGNFDGVHPGHLAVLEEAAGGEGGIAVLCLEPVTRQYFGGAEWHRRLTTAWERMKLLERKGVDEVLVLPFRKELAETLPGDFLDDLLLRFSFERLVVGYDFSFGRGGAGTVEQLRAWGDKKMVEIRVVPPVVIGGSPVKSTRIRDLLETGDVPGAGELLGRRYSLTGAVSRGKGLGRRLGFPTLNVRVPKCKLLPAAGSYRGCLYSKDGKRMEAAVFVPGDTGGPVEVHVIDGDPGLVYGDGVVVGLMEKLRDVVRGIPRQELGRLIMSDVRRIESMSANERDERRTH